MTDPLADMLTRIRNALLRGKPTVITPASKLRENVLSVLQDEGYIRGFMKLEIEGEFPMFEIELKYSGSLAFLRSSSAILVFPLNTIKINRHE